LLPVISLCTHPAVLCLNKGVKNHIDKIRNLVGEDAVLIATSKAVTDPHKIAESILGEIDWKNADRGSCTCPGAKRSVMANSDSSDQSKKKYIDISSEQRDVIFVPFTPQVSLGSSSMNVISRELRDTVSEYEAKGFEFMRIDTVHVDIRPGCIMAMFGKQTEYHPYEFLVFRKKAS